MDVAELKTILELSGKQQHDAGLADSERKIDQFAESANRSMTNAARGSDVYRDAQGRLRDSTGKFVKDTEAGFTSVGSSVNTLGGRFKVFESISTGIFERIGHRITDSFLNSLYQIPAAVYSIGTDFESAMNLFQATTGATADQMKRASEVAEKLGADMKLPATSAADAGNAMSVLASKGFDAEQSMQAVRGALELAAAAGISEAEAARMVATAINAFGLEASEASRVTDLFAAASVKGGVSMQDLGIALQQSAATAKSLKVPIEDTVTLLAAMARAGIQGSDAGTSLKTAFIRLVPTTKEAAEEMRKLGLNVFDSQGKLKSVEDILGQLSGTTSKLTDHQKLHAIQTIFGTDAQRAANIMLELGAEKFKKLKEQVTQSGAAQELAAARTKGLGGAVEGLKSQAETLALKLFQSVAPSLEIVTRKAADVVGAFADLSPATQNQILVFGALALAQGPLTRAFGAIVAGIQGVITWMKSLSAQSGATKAALITFANTAVGILANVAKSMEDVGKKAASLPGMQEIGRQARERRQADQTARVAAGAPVPYAGQLSTVMGGIESMIQNSINKSITGAGEGGKKIADNLAKGIGGGSGKVKDTAKEIFDVFEAGLAGLMKATEFVKARLGEDGLFGKIAKSGQEEMRRLKQAVEVVTPALESFFAAAGLKANITTERLLAMGATAKPLLNLSLSFQSLKDRIETINFQRVAAGLAPLNDELKIASRVMSVDVPTGAVKMAKEIEISFNTFKALPIEVIKKMEALGFTFKTVFPEASLSTSKFTEVATEKMQEAAGAFDATKDSIDNLGKGLEQLAKPPDFAGGIIQQAARIKTALENDIGLATARAANEIRASIDSMILDYERLADNYGLTGAAFERFVEVNMRESLRSWGVYNAQQIEQIVETWKKGLHRLPGVWEDVLGRLPSSTKSILNDVFDLFDLIPGKFGDTLRKVQGEVERWISIVTKVFSILDSIFNRTVQGAQNAAGAIGGILGGGGGGGLGGLLGQVGGFFGRIFGGGGAAGSTAALPGFAGAGGAGGLGGLGGLGAFFTNPWTIGIGAGIAGIFALKKLFKSRDQRIMEHQKRLQSELQTEIMREQRQQAGIQTQQMVLETVKIAQETFEKLADYTAVPRQVIDKFFRDFKRVLNRFFELAQQFSDEMLERGKKFAESVGPVVEVIGGAVLALDALGSYIPFAEKSLDNFIRNLGQLVTKMAALEEELPNKIEKQAKKFAKRIGPIAEVMANAVGGLSSLFNFQPVSASMIDQFGESLKLAVEKIGAIADEMDKFMVKAAARFAERAAVVVELVGGAVEAFSKLSDFKAPGAGLFDALFKSIKQAIDQMTEMVKTLDLEMLGQAEAVALKSGAIFEALRSALETFSSLREYTELPGDALRALVNDMKRAISILSELVDDSAKALEIAKRFRINSEAINTELRAGFKALDEWMRAIGEAQTQPGAVVGESGFAFATAGSYTDQSVVFERGSIHVEIGGAEGMDAEEIGESIAQRIVSALRQRRG